MLSSIWLPNLAFCGSGQAGLRGMAVHLLSSTQAFSTALSKKHTCCLCMQRFFGVLSVNSCTRAQGTHSTNCSNGGGSQEGAGARNSTQNCPMM